MAEHLLDAAQVGAALQQVRGEGVAQQVRVDAGRVETRLRRRGAHDQEGTGARQAAALRVEEQLGPVARVEERPPTRHVDAQRLDGSPPDRDDPLLVALAGDAHEAALEIDAAALQAGRLADAQAGAVQQLQQRAVAQVARADAARRLDQPLRLVGRERAGQGPSLARQIERRGRVVSAHAEQHEVPVEGA